jgi:hypothetical protein
MVSERSSLEKWGRAETCPDPVRWPADWVACVSEAMTETELERVRRSVNRGTSFGSEAWAVQTAQDLGLEASLQPPRAATQGPGKL